MTRKEISVVAVGDACLPNTSALDRDDAFFLLHVHSRAAIENEKVVVILLDIHSRINTQ